jgi:mono/diheme cytochrome c family protein
VSVPAPTAQQLAFADPHGSATQRGAAVYFAQGCADCHGPAGIAPGELALSGPSDASAIRGGGLGMPRYPEARLPDAQLADLLAFVATLNGRARSR